MSHHEALLSYLLISPYSFISPIGLSSTCTDEGEGDLQVSSSTAFIPLLVYVFISVIFVLVVLCLQLACIIQFKYTEYKVPEYSSKEPHLPAPLGTLPHKPQHRSTMKLTLCMVQRTSSKHKKTSWEKKTLAKVVAIYVPMQYTAHVDVLV